MNTSTLLSTMLFILKVLLASILFPSCIFAQEFKKGDWVAGTTTGLIGGYAGANNVGLEEDFIFSISLTPEVGRFITDRISVGGQFGFGLETDFSFSVLVLGLTPYIRTHYKNSEKLSSFFEIGGGMFMVNATPFTNFGAIASARYGLDYFISDSVSIGGRLGPSLTYFDDTFNLDLGLRFGILFIFKRQT